ncbi:MAG: YIEGIA family protein [Desulfocucumaceae bacterium]
MDSYLMMVIAGTLAGTLSRLLLLRMDYRQYPGYPHGMIAHLSLGFIASAIGAVSVPAILKPDFAAVTFLALAAQQFREIRKTERETLGNLDKTELIRRGNDYIEGIARTFEARNFLVMFTALLVAVAYYYGRIPGAIIMTLLLILFSRSFMSGETIDDICTVVPAKLHFVNSLLKIDEIDVMNVGLKDMQQKIINEGLAVKIIPKGLNATAVLNDMGQRMAIAHTAATVLGSKKDIDTPELTPLARKNIDTGEIGLYILPLIKDMEALILAVKRTPVLESARSKPLSTGAGRIAAKKND